MLTTCTQAFAAIVLATTAAVSPAALKNTSLRNPMSGGTLAGYAGDTGLDVAGKFLPVYAMAAGTLDYSERGHTHWTDPPDTPLSVRLALDQPLEWREPDPRNPRRTTLRRVTHIYYTHLSELRFAVPECTQAPCPPRVRVAAGERLGVSGIGNRSPHLHVGMLLDGDVSQTSWTFIMREHQIRAVIGGYRNGQRL